MSANVELENSNLREENRKLWAVIESVKRFAARPSRLGLMVTRIAIDTVEKEPRAWPQVFQSFDVVQCTTCGASVQTFSQPEAEAVMRGTCYECKGPRSR